MTQKIEPLTNRITSEARFFFMFSELTKKENRNAETQKRRNAETQKRRNETQKKLLNRTFCIKERQLPTTVLLNGLGLGISCESTLLNQILFVCLYCSVFN